MRSDGQIADIKPVLGREDILALLALCRYMPTPEKMRIMAEQYAGSPSAEAFGYEADGRYLGAVIAEPLDAGTLEIKAIAVNERFRGLGIGRKLVIHLRQLHSDKALTAETDGDAVEFYRSCGFLAEEIDRFPHVRRYRCELAPVEDKA